MLGSFGVSATVTLAGEQRVDGTEVTYERRRERVDGILVAPGSTSDGDASRPAGTRVALTLYWPRGHHERLSGATVELGGVWSGTYRVVGDPMPYPDEMLPPGCPHCMVVEVERSDG